MSVNEKTLLQGQSVSVEEVKPDERENLPEIVPDTVTEAVVQDKKGKRSSFFQKIGAPANRLANSLGSQEFWPMTLDKESEKATRILQSFTTEAVYTDCAQSDGDAPPAYESPSKEKGRSTPVLVKIPQAVLHNAVGLAIFSTIRAGFHASLTSGSGVLIARLADGSWSPPSGILVHSMGVGFNVGIDMYDCVVVINSVKALDAFRKMRVSLSGELSVAVGPLGGGGMLDADFGRDRDRKPLFMYMKCRGLYLGVQVNGTIISERTDENARFYGHRVPAADILAGKVQSDSRGTMGLQAAIRGAEGTERTNEKVLEYLNHHLSMACSTGSSSVGDVSRQSTSPSQEPATCRDQKSPTLGQAASISDSAKTIDYYDTEDYVEVSGRAPDMAPEYSALPRPSVDTPAPPRYE